MILKAALLAAAWAGKSRRRGLESIAKMPIDEKDKEILFLRDRIYQLETQIKIFQKQIQSNPIIILYKPIQPKREAIHSLADGILPDPSASGNKDLWYSQVHLVPLVKPN
jgi:hypothetical protein